MKYVIEFDSLEELNLVLAAVGKLPYEQVAHIMKNMKVQGEKQLAEQQLGRDQEQGQSSL